MGLVFGKKTKLDRLQEKKAQLEVTMAQEKLRRMRRVKIRVIPETSEDHTRESVADYRERLRRIKNGKR